MSNKRNIEKSQHDKLLLEQKHQALKKTLAKLQASYEANINQIEKKSARKEANELAQDYAEKVKKQRLAKQSSIPGQNSDTVAKKDI